MAYLCFIDPGLFNLVAAGAAHAHLKAVLANAEAHTGLLVALRADQHHIGQVQLAFELDDLRRDLAIAGLARLLVLLQNVHARNLDAIFLREHGDHFAALAQILAGDHLDGIALLDPLHVRNPLLRYYRVSGARDAIFKKPLSRSSRATGPKTRVPRGFCRS